MKLFLSYGSACCESCTFKQFSVNFKSKRFCCYASICCCCYRCKKGKKKLVGASGCILSTSAFMASFAYLCGGAASYLVVAVHGSSNLPAALRRCCRDAVAEGEGLVAMVAGRVLERSLRGGVELQGTLGKESRSYQLRQECCMVE